MGKGFTDETLKILEQNSGIYGEGERPKLSSLDRILEMSEDAESNKFGPKIEFIDSSKKGTEIGDTRNLTVDYVATFIYNEWKETPDTLIPLEITRFDNNSGLLIGAAFDSSEKPEGVVKVVYQFVRKGSYNEEEYTGTSIYRYEFRDPKNGYKGGGVKELVGVLRQPGIPMGLPDEPKKFELAENEFEDPKTGCIVSYSKIEVD